MSTTPALITDVQAMQLALAQAELAGAAGEVPVGAVLLKDGVLIASGRNAPIAHCDPSAHAEIIALRAAAQRLGNYRLDDCELFVTLEPCAMCSGALLHARLKRVVFGAADLKTGSAGSVLNLFAQRQLNHHTQIQGGVLAEPCAALLSQFFQHKRQQLRQSSSPLREDALRTPAARFANLPDYPWPARYVSDLPSLAGLRLHYIDEGPRDAPLNYVCLHSHATWSYHYRHLIATLLAAGQRVLAPDLIGFGKSDKPKKTQAHSLDWHRQVWCDWVRWLDLQRIVLVLPDTDDALGRSLMQLDEWRYSDVLPMSPQPPTSAAAEQAPFPDAGHRAGPRALAAYFVSSTVVNWP